MIYVRLEEINPDELKEMLNKGKNREHLIEHDFFDLRSVKKWLKEKLEIDRTNGCRVRGIISDNTFAGWCGIQLENGKYEIAIVLDNNYWGVGKKVFKEVMLWAKELGHEEVYIHLRHTRPEYKYLKKIAKNVFISEQLGEKHTTYQLSVG